MSIMVDHEIELAIELGHLIVEPYDPTRLQPNSLDVTLHDEFTYFGEMVGSVDPYNPDSINYGTTHRIADQIVIHPGEFILGATREKFTLPDNIVGQLTGKSSLARLGIMIHVTAGYIDAGFSHPAATITLELFNVSKRSVILYAGMPIGQMVFTKTAAARIPYHVRRGKYNGQKPAALSQYYLNERPTRPQASE